MVKKSDSDSVEKEIIEIIKEATQNFSANEIRKIYQTQVENLMKEPVLNENKKGL